VSISSPGNHPTVPVVSPMSHRELSVLMAGLLVTSLVTGIVAADPPRPGTEGNGLTENESSTLWSRDADSYISQEEYRQRYGENRPLSIRSPTGRTLRSNGRPRPRRRGRGTTSRTSTPAVQIRPCIRRTRTSRTASSSKMLTQRSSHSSPLPEGTWSPVRPTLHRAQWDDARVR